MRKRRKTDDNRFIHPSGRKLRENIWKEDEASETLWRHTFPSQAQEEIRFFFVLPSNTSLLLLLSSVFPLLITRNFYYGNREMLVFAVSLIRKQKRSDKNPVRRSTSNVLGNIGENDSSKDQSSLLRWMLDELHKRSLV